MTGQAAAQELMSYIGIILPAGPSEGNVSNWMDLIATHAQLAPVLSRTGVHPYTREPVTFNARPDAAHVLSGEERIGMVHWAVDGSQRLVVWSRRGAEDKVIEVAEVVADALGWRYSQPGNR